MPSKRASVFNYTGVTLAILDSTSSQKAKAALDGADETDLVLSSDQRQALEWLRSGENVFVTGGAGSGKSFLIREFLREVDTDLIPILASTGTAAVLLGGRTFHSFFGLGIMEGGPAATLERGLKNSRLLKRLRKIEGFVIDEISMISGAAFETAEALSRGARESSLPWGGLRVIAVGDFSQLPPVSQGSKKDWCFQNNRWAATAFQTMSLIHNQRVQESEFLNVLQSIRRGQVTDEVREFLDLRVRFHDEDESGTRLFPRRNQSEDHNNRKLAQINCEEVVIPSIYFGSEKHQEILMKNSPVPIELKIKIGCEVLFLQNDPQKRWVNGTRGIVTEIHADRIRVKKATGREVQVDKVQFSMMDAEGQVLASLIQFPLALGYATTIHKSQGATLDSIWCDLGSLWEPGQAYVALSRLRNSAGLNLIRWTPRSIMVDPEVQRFYRNLSCEI